MILASRLPGAATLEVAIVEEVLMADSVEGVEGGAWVDALATCCIISRRTRSVLSAFSESNRTFSLDSRNFSSSTSRPSLFASSSSFSVACSALYTKTAYQMVARSE
jgi:hypothetical protein